MSDIASGSTTGFSSTGSDAIGDLIVTAGSDGSGNSEGTNIVINDVTQDITFNAENSTFNNEVFINSGGLKLQSDDSSANYGTIFSTVLTTDVSLVLPNMGVTPRFSPVSVNGIYANSSGDITVATGGSQTLEQTLVLGNTATSDINLATVNLGGNINWTNGSKLYEQNGATPRMIYQPNGDRFEVLNEAGTAFVASFHGANSANPNQIKLYKGTSIGNSYSTSNTPPVDGLIVEGAVGIGNKYTKHQE